MRFGLKVVSQKSLLSCYPWLPPERPGLEAEWERGHKTGAEKAPSGKGKPAGGRDRTHVAGSPWKAPALLDYGKIEQFLCCKDQVGTSLAPWVLLQIWVYLVNPALGVCTPRGGPCGTLVVTFSRNNARHLYTPWLRELSNYRLDFGKTTDQLKPDSNINELVAKNITNARCHGAYAHKNVYIFFFFDSIASLVDLIKLLFRHLTQVQSW